jgi:hypothetical protein
MFLPYTNTSPSFPLPFCAMFRNDCGTIVAHMEEDSAEAKTSHLVMPERGREGKREREREVILLTSMY